MGDIFHTSEKIGDSQLKLSFISPQKCINDPAVLIVSGSDKFLFKFNLVDIYVTRIFPANEEEKYKYYIRYTYIAFIKKIGELTEFDYYLL